MDIFNFVYYRTVLDGWNGQIGALGVPGIAFGAVMRNGGVVVKCPDLPHSTHLMSRNFFFDILGFF